MKTPKNFKELKSISTGVQVSYFFNCSYELANSVYDYCSDSGISLDFEEFRLVCVMISNATGVMLPKASNMRHLVSLFSEVA